MKKLNSNKQNKRKKFVCEEEEEVRDEEEDHHYQTPIPKGIQTISLIYIEKSPKTIITQKLEDFLVEEFKEYAL